MGTWSTPCKAEDAEKLKTLMATKIRIDEAENKLYDLMGDDDLFDEFYHFDADADARWLIVDTLDEWLDHPERFRKLWDKEAIAICKQIVQDFKNHSEI